jgi:hypothetical protein
MEIGGGISAKSDNESFLIFEVLVFRLSFDGGQGAIGEPWIKKKIPLSKRRALS